MTFDAGCRLLLLYPLRTFFLTLAEFKPLIMLMLSYANAASNGISIRLTYVYDISGPII